MKGLSGGQFLRFVGGACVCALTAWFVQCESALGQAEAPKAAPAAAATPTAQPPGGDAAAKGKGPREGRPGAEKAPGAEAKPDGEKKPDGQPADGKAAEKKAEEVVPIKRSAEPPQPADPAELKVRPDDAGFVTFSFKGQSWQAVLEWLADISSMSLEWQEAPGGFLDLTTRRKYTVDEARDLINSILLAKGFTLLRNGEVLLVVNLKNLDVSLVPRVLPAELDQRGNYELVRTFFDLNRLQAETMAEELKPLLSPYAKIAALKTTNRLDVLETAGNLRRLREVLVAEQGSSGKNHEFRQFKLVHARADDALLVLNDLLGLEKKQSGPMNPEQMQRQMQQMQQMQQQMQQQQQQGGKGGPTKPTDEPKVSLAINRRENAILAFAPPDKLSVIEEAVDLIDVPSGGSGSPLANVARVRIYRLVGADPAPIVNVLKELGNLDPTTRLEVDNANRAILVNGPLVDHVTVQALIDKLDGSARRFEVVKLRKLDAEYVAGSIEFLLRGPNTDTARPRYVFGNYQTPQQSKDGGFQVEADTKNNRLLLRVNDIELEEIRALLIKLGEDPFTNTQADNMRVIRTSPGNDTQRLLERLKKVWPSLSPNPLQIEVQPEETTPDSPDAPNSNSKGRGQESTSKGKAKIQDANRTNEEPAEPMLPVQRTARVGGNRARTVFIAADGGENIDDARDSASAKPTLDLAQNEAPPEGAPGRDNAVSDAPTDDLQLRPRPAQRGSDVARPGDQQRETPPPISIVHGPQGLIITSRDAATVDQLTRLIDELSPANSRYATFTLKHTYAKDVAYLLEAVFQDDDGKDRRQSPFFFFFDEPSGDKKERGRLSKRQPLKFTADSVTNSILVQNADDEQLAEIKSLIDFYDKAEPPDSQSIRKTEIVPVRYAKAQAVADVIKDVYRDLLSPTDKALQSGQQQQRQDQPRPFWSYMNTDSSKQSPENVPRFKGLLSIGVDVASNSLVVSAPQFMMIEVLAMAKRLDEATKPMEPVVRVISVGGALEDPYIKDSLRLIADPDAKRTATSGDSRSRQNDRQGTRNRDGGGGRNRGSSDNNRGGNQRSSNR